MKSLINKFIILALLSSASIASLDLENLCSLNIVVTPFGPARIDENGDIEPLGEDEEDELIKELERRKLLGITCARESTICVSY